MSRYCRMPPKRKKVTPGGDQQKKRIATLRSAVREAAAARRARQAEVQESTPVRDRDVEMSQAEASSSSRPTARPITAEDLVAVITGVLQAQQAQQPPPPPPPPPPAPVVKTAASLITDFVRISPPTFTGEGDPILAEKWEEQIDKHLDALEVKDEAMKIKIGRAHV